MNNIRSLTIFRAAFFLSLSCLCILGFLGAARSYGMFLIPQGWGVYTIVPDELAFYAWYAVFGSAAILFLMHALRAMSVGTVLERALRSGIDRPGVLILSSGALLLVVLLALYFTVFRGAPIADDESTYVFIARTLLQGRVVNPSPGDPEILWSQFVVHTASGWYGKYPIGHPLLLALGEAIGARFLVTPLLTVLTLVVTWLVGRRVFDPRVAGLSVCLLLVSPQFVLTGVTQLSQPSSTLFMMLGVLTMLRLREKPDPARAAVSALCWSYGILVRPMPGALFLIAAFAYFMLDPAYGDWWSGRANRLKMIAAAAVPVLLTAALFASINHEQTGSLLRTGYHELHGGSGLASGMSGHVGLSFFGALLRQSFWLLGWPLSFVFIPFSRRPRTVWLLWSMVAAEYGYRLLVPKTVVATTGPIYVAEVVPVLVLMSADGMVQLRGWLARTRLERARELLVPAVCAAVVVGLVMFVPVQLMTIRRACDAQNRLREELDRVHAAPALVFCDEIVSDRAGVTWAYYPPPPSPTLNDDVIFVRWDRREGGTARMIDFWRRRFPERSVWLYDAAPVNRPRLYRGIPRFEPVDRP
jgi:hypothetical protein